jgi:hypothetical protein
VERRGTEWNGGERSGTEWNGGERSGNPPSIFTGVPPPNDGSGKEGNYIRRLYIPFTLRRSNLTAGAPGSTFFFALNPDVREIVHLLNKIEMLFKYCPLHQRINLSDKS